MGSVCTSPVLVYDGKNHYLYSFKNHMNSQCAEFKKRQIYAIISYSIKNNIPGVPLS